MMRGFTLIELLISFAIISVIMGSVLGVFGSYIKQSRVQDSGLKINHTIQLVEKQLYIDLLGISPFITISKNGDIYVKGEEADQAIPQFITLYNEDTTEANGYERLSFYTVSLDPFGTYDSIDYEYNSSSKTLIRSTEGSEKILGTDLDEFHFIPLKKGLKILAKITTDKRSESFSTVFPLGDSLIRFKIGEQGNE